MRKKEVVQHAKQRAQGFRSHTDQAYQQHRSSIIDWMCQLNETLKLGNLTLHTAIGFLDRFIDVIPIDASRLKLVGAATVLIAGLFSSSSFISPSLHLL